MNRVTVLLLGASVVGTAFSGGTIGRLAPGDLCGSDFAVFYAGGELLGTPQLYSAAAAQAIQNREMGCTSASAMFVRLPYFAAMMRPWTAMPFWTSFANGQDICFLLMVLAVAQSFWMKGATGKAGATLALCAAKFHLFLLMPIVFWPGMKRTIFGMALGGALLLGVCFAVQGPAWPRQFLAAGGNIFLVSPVGCVLMTISSATARVASLLLLALAWLMAFEVKMVKQFAQARTAD